VDEGGFRGTEVICRAYQLGGLASVPQCLVRDVGADLVTEPEGIDDAARSVVDAKGVRLVNLDLVAADVEGGSVELVSADGGRHAWLLGSAGQRDIVRGRDDVGQLMPGER
jgi:hypothetical protein